MGKGLPSFARGNREGWDTGQLAQLNCTGRGKMSCQSVSEQFKRQTKSEVL